MAACLSRVLFSILLFWLGELGYALPASSTTPTTTPSASPPSTVVSPTVAPTGETGPAGSASDSFTKIIIIVVIFCVLPLAGLWFCCHRRGACFGRKEKQRHHYNASYPNQVPGGVFLVPVNQFIPHDDPKMGYAVRVDTPANARDATTPAPPMYQEMMMTPPPRAATPAGKMAEKNGGWKSLFRA